MTYAPHISDLIEDFSFMDDWEDRYSHVIDLGKDLAPLQDCERNDMTKVKGCVSQVWLIRDEDNAQRDRLFYRGDSDAHIVKGLVYIIIHVYSGMTAQDILKTDISDIIAKIGLAEHLSAQRSNGLKAMITRIQAEAKTLLNQ